MQRFVHDDWVPKKLEIELQVPHGENPNIDCEVYRSAGGGKPVEGEDPMPEAAVDEPAEIEPELNGELLNMVL